MIIVRWIKMVKIGCGGIVCIMHESELIMVGKGLYLGQL